jgi:acyl-CoA thioesterase-1
VILNLFLYHLVSGQAWFSCGLLFLLVLGFDLAGAFARRPRLGRAARLLLLTAVAIAAASTTPMSLWQAVLLLIVCLAYTLFGFASRARRRRLVLGGAAAIAVVPALALELPYYLSKPPQAPRPRRNFVIGDSLAAGIGGEKATWPKRLSELSRVEVRDLSAQGANVHWALRQQIPTVQREGRPDDWVLISVGGNDMLGPTSTTEFGEKLDMLLAAARGDPNHPRLAFMQELPLIPWAGAFGLWQRRLAAKYDVVLIPKRLLAAVVLDKENVLDGLHLSPAGHERMAESMAQWLGLP